MVHKYVKTKTCDAKPKHVQIQNLYKTKTCIINSGYKDEVYFNEDTWTFRWGDEQLLWLGHEVDEGRVDEGTGWMGTVYEWDEEIAMTTWRDIIMRTRGYFYDDRSAIAVRMRRYCYVWHEGLVMTTRGYCLWGNEAFAMTTRGIATWGHERYCSWWYYCIALEDDGYPGMGYGYGMDITADL